MLTEAQKQKATEALREFTISTWDMVIQPYLVTESIVPFYYTQTLDGRHDLQYYADFENAEVYLTVDGERVDTAKYADFDAMCSYIVCMTEAGLVDYADDYCYEHGICEYR